MLSPQVDTSTFFDVSVLGEGGKSSPTMLVAPSSVGSEEGRSPAGLERARPGRVPVEGAFGPEDVIPGAPVDGQGPAAAAAHNGGAGDREIKTQPRKEKLKTRLKPTPPTGVLAVHIKKLHLRVWNALTMFDSPEISVYVRIKVGSTVKWTSAYDQVSFPSALILDEIKHFTVTLSSNRADESNNVSIDLLGFDRPDVHMIIARYTVHLYTIVKKLYASETCELYRLPGHNVKPEMVCELEVEYCMAYGDFGYGCSNQLENRTVQPRDQIKHSMFVRLAPPAGRKSEEMPDVMASKPVGHPGYIPFTTNAYVGDVGLACGSDLEVLASQIDEPVLTICKLRSRLNQLQKEYSSQPTRKARVAFLRDLVYNANLAQDSGEEILAPKAFHQRRRANTVITLDKDANAANILIDPTTGTIQGDEHDEGATQRRTAVVVDDDLPPSISKRKSATRRSSNTINLLKEKWEEEHGSGEAEEVAPSLLSRVKARLWGMTSWMKPGKSLNKVEPITSDESLAEPSSSVTDAPDVRESASTQAAREQETEAEELTTSQEQLAAWVARRWQRRASKQQKVTFTAQRSGHSDVTASIQEEDEEEDEVSQKQDTSLPVEADDEGSSIGSTRLRVSEEDMLMPLGDQRSSPMTSRRPSPMMASRYRRTPDHLSVRMDSAAFEREPTPSSMRGQGAMGHRGSMQIRSQQKSRRTTGLMISLDKKAPPTSPATKPETRRMSMWGRLRGIVATTEEAPAKPEVQFNIPRVMITPSTPETSSDSDWYSDEDDDFY